MVRKLKKKKKKKKKKKTFSRPTDLILLYLKLRKA